MKKSLLVVLMSMVLGACGSSGGDANLSKNLSSIDIVRYPQVKAIDSIPDEDVRKQVAAEKDKWFLSFSGHNFDMGSLPKGVMTKEIGGKNFRIINLPYSVAAFGSSKTIAKGRLDLFFEAVPDTDKDHMPRHTVTYSGYSGSLNVAGKMHLDMDFAKKILSGQLYERRNNNGETLPDIILKEANYEEDYNFFRGKTDYQFNEGGYKLEYEVRFVGPSAEEAIGIVYEPLRSSSGITIAPIFL